MSEKQIGQGRSYTRKKIQNFSYGLNDAIGKGYSSCVYKGRNDDSEEPVAVKVIDLKMLKCQINRTLLASQIDILKSMKDAPHILTLHEVYTTKNNTYIITELCESDLSRKIKKKLPEKEVHSYMEQFLIGYEQIFKQKLVHRDLKPANLLLTHANCLKIADFGFGIKAQEVLRPSKYNVGSPLYMAPESLKRNQYSFKTDIWAIGIIFFEMLTGDTPWRAKNEKELIKKIQSQKIDSILSRHSLSSLANQFLTRALNQDKNGRMSPEQMLKFQFSTSPKQNNILGEKKMNLIKTTQKFQSIINDLQSPKALNDGRSVQKRIFQERSQKKLHVNAGSTQNLQNCSFRNIENLGNKTKHSPQKQVVSKTIMNKEERKHISKLLIAEVHFCRFLYKLLGRIKDSANQGLFQDDPSLSSAIFRSFTSIIQHKITKLYEFEIENYLEAEVLKEKYDEYKSTSDFKKLIKIAKDYYERYSIQLKAYWQTSNVKSVPLQYRQAIDEVSKSIEFLLLSLSDQPIQKEFLNECSKDIIILDYLITCKQLLEMIERQVKNKGVQNYERFAKKSRIQEIVEGTTSQINPELFCKIIERGRLLVKN